MKNEESKINVLFFKIEKMKQNILREKSYSFALKIVFLSRSLINEKKYFVISKQLVRSGTSIGALICEAEFGQSKADFINKMNIALKEANETDYCHSILKDKNLIDENQYNLLVDECKQIIAMLVATIKTSTLKIQSSKK